MTYAIHVVHKWHPIKGFAQRVIFAPERQHSFFVLAKDDTPIAEIHFTAKSRKGETAKKVRALNVIQAVADLAGVGTPFQAVTKALRLNRYFFLLKGVETSSRIALDDPLIGHYGTITGDQAHIMAAWNRICALALEINRAEIPFTHNPRWARRAPANCQAAMKSTLAQLGPEFDEVARNIAHKNGRRLHIRRFGSSLAQESPYGDLEARHEVLKQQMYASAGFRNERVKRNLRR